MEIELVTEGLQFPEGPGGMVAMSLVIGVMCTGR